MSTIYLIRHGQASFESENYDSLSSTGVKQAQVLGEYFNKIGKQFDAVFSGTLDRQIVTAKEMSARMQDEAGNWNHQILPGFNEHDGYGIIAGQIDGLLADDPSLEDDYKKIRKDHESFMRVFSRSIQRWMSGKYDNPGAETYQEFIARVRDAFGQAVQMSGEDSTFAVVSSGGPITTAFRMAVGIPLDESVWLGLRVLNTAVSVFTHTKGQLQLAAFNSIAHLELQNDSGLITFL